MNRLIALAAISMLAGCAQVQPQAVLLCQKIATAETVALVVTPSMAAHNSKTLADANAGCALVQAGAVTPPVPVVTAPATP